MQTTIRTNTPQRPTNVEPPDRTTTVAFFVMMGAMVAALLYFLALPLFI